MLNFAKSSSLRNAVCCRGFADAGRKALHHRVQRKIAGRRHIKFVGLGIFEAKVEDGANSWSDAPCLVQKPTIAIETTRKVLTLLQCSMVGVIIAAQSAVVIKLVDTAVAKAAPTVTARIPSQTKVGETIALTAQADPDGVPALGCRFWSDDSDLQSAHCLNVTGVKQCLAPLASAKRRSSYRDRR